MIFFVFASKSKQNSVSLGPSTPCRRKIPCVCAKTAGEYGTKLSAWTSVRQERWEGDLAVEGHIPAWLVRENYENTHCFKYAMFALNLSSVICLRIMSCNVTVIPQNGTYLRNGPGQWEVGDHSCHHIFDGYATLVRVSFRRGRATGAHRQIESEAYKAARKHGRPIMREFSQLCASHPVSPLERLHNLVGIGSGALLSDNANISVHQLGDGRVICLTETTKSTILIDPETLGTIGKFHYEDMVWGLLQSTHPIVTRTELLTLLPDFTRRGHLVVRMAAGSNERKVIGRVHCRGGMAPGWVHSFAVTENYIVVPEMPLRYSVGAVLKSELTPWYIFDWLPASGSYMHVICRSTGKTVSGSNIYVWIDVGSY